MPDTSQATQQPFRVKGDAGSVCQIIMVHMRISEQCTVDYCNYIIFRQRLAAGSG